ILCRAGHGIGGAGGTGGDRAAAGAGGGAARVRRPGRTGERRAARGLRAHRAAGLAHGAGVAATGAGGLTAPRVSPVGAASAAPRCHGMHRGRGSRLEPLLRGAWMLAGVARAWSRLTPLLQEDDLVWGMPGPRRGGPGSLRVRLRVRRWPSWPWPA